MSEVMTTIALQGLSSAPHRVNIESLGLTMVDELEETSAMLHSMLLIHVTAGHTCHLLKMRAETSHSSRRPCNCEWSHSAIPPINDCVNKQQGLPSYKEISRALG